MLPPSPAPRDPAAPEHEIKWLAPASQVAALSAFLRGVCRLEQPHAGGRVESIYFDTPDLAALAEKLGSDFLKTKVRLRWYPPGPVAFVELKQREGTQRTKQRMALPVDGAALAAADLDGPWLRGVAVGALGEVAHLPVGLRPVGHFGYHRERFVAPGGARVSLDSDLRLLRLARRFGPRRTLGSLPWAVVEVKGSIAAAPAVLAALPHFGCRRGSFSKYAAGLAHAAGLD